MQAEDKASAIQAGIDSECSKLGHKDETQEERAIRLASLVVLLQQVEDKSVTQHSADKLGRLVSTLIEQDLQPSANPHVQKNAIALLTSLVSLDSALWRHLVIEQHALVPALVSSLKSSLSSQEVDEARVINLLAALAAVAQQGEEGAWSIVDCQGQAVINSVCGASTSESSAQVQEAAADLICQMATYEGPVRAAIVKAGTVNALASLLTPGDVTDRSEVHVRALLGLGMLVANNPSAQLQLASHANIKDLMAVIQHSPDPDAKEIGKDLFKALARTEECRNAMASAMRSMVNVDAGK